MQQAGARETFAQIPFGPIALDADRGHTLVGRLVCRIVRSQFGSRAHHAVQIRSTILRAFQRLEDGQHPRVVALRE